MLSGGGGGPRIPSRKKKTQGGLPEHVGGEPAVQVPDESKKIQVKEKKNQPKTITGGKKTKSHGDETL